MYTVEYKGEPGGKMFVNAPDAKTAAVRAWYLHSERHVRKIEVARVMVFNQERDYS